MTPRAALATGCYIGRQRVRPLKAIPKLYELVVADHDAVDCVADVACVRNLGNVGADVAADRTLDRGRNDHDTVAAEFVADFRRQRSAQHLHRLGPRAVLEALAEVADGGDLDRVLSSYGRLDPEIVRALRGDRFPPPLPLHVVVPE